VVARFVQQVLSGQAPTVFGHGRQTRDFVYIEDNVRAGLAAMDEDGIQGEVINVGTGKETTINELAQIVIQAAGKEGELQPQLLPSRTFEIQRRCASIEKMDSLLKMTCSVPLTEGIRELIDWYRPAEESFNLQTTRQLAEIGA
jgi:UDP-glucose 4-epimerase